MNHYISSNGELVRPEEVKWKALAEQKSWSSVTLCPATQLWLSVQRSVRNALAGLFDGRSHERFPFGFGLGRLLSSSMFSRGPWLDAQALALLRNQGVPISQSVTFSDSFSHLREFLKCVEPYLLMVPDELERYSEVVRVPEIFDGSSYRKRREWKELSVLLSGIQGEKIEGVDVYLHGSMASMDYTAFSDVDDLVIVRRACWNSEANLRHAARLMSAVAHGFQVVDPLQHHGHFVVTEFDLQCYDQSIMPVVVLQSAKVVRGPQCFAVFARDSRAGFRRDLWRTIQGVRVLALEAQLKGLSLYWLKHLVGKIVLIPALLFQSEGIYLDKRSAIVRSREIFGGESWQAIEWASTVREEWARWLSIRRKIFLRLVINGVARRRHLAEALIARIMPRRRVGVFPCPNAVSVRSMCRLTDEAATTLGQLIGNECS